MDYFYSKRKFFKRNYTKKQPDARIILQVKRTTTCNKTSCVTFEKINFDFTWILLMFWISSRKYAKYGKDNIANSDLPAQRFCFNATLSKQMVLCMRWAQIFFNNARWIFSNWYPKNLLGNVKMSLAKYISSIKNSQSMRFSLNQ